MNDFSKVLKTEIEKRMAIKPLVFTNGVDEIVKLVADKLTKTMKEDHLKYDSWLAMATMGIPFVIDDNMMELSMQDVFWGIIEHFADIKTDANSTSGGGATYTISNAAATKYWGFSEES